MDDLERDARRHLAKVEQTVEFLRNNKLNDPLLPDRKKQYIQKDVDALNFLLLYAKEALTLRGVQV